MKKEWGKSFSVEDKELEALSQQNIKKPNEGKSVKKNYVCISRCSTCLIRWTENGLRVRKSSDRS